MIADASETLTKQWNAYGKVELAVQNGDTTRYAYDGAGNKVWVASKTDTTHYVRDGSGNVLGIYENSHIKELNI